MTPNALSRFFKQHTNRSISGYINEVRIGQATLLLVDKNDGNAVIVKVVNTGNIDDLAYVNDDMQWILEPGQFRATVAGLSANFDIK